MSIEAVESVLRQQLYMLPLRIPGVRISCPTELGHIVILARINNWDANQSVDFAVTVRLSNTTAVVKDGRHVRVFQFSDPDFESKVVEAVAGSVMAATEFHWSHTVPKLQAALVPPIKCLDSGDD